MTFAHYDFKRGSSIHEHFHPQEEVYEVMEGELELNIDGVKQVARTLLHGGGAGDSSSTSTCQREPSIKTFRPVPKRQLPDLIVGACVAVLCVHSG